MKKLLLYAYFSCIALVFILWGYDAAGPSKPLLGNTAGLLHLFGRLAGLAAAAGILTELVLMSRAGWIESLYGLDRLARTHHFLGLAIPAALILHPALIVGGALASGFSLGALLHVEDIPAAFLGALIVLAAAGLSVQKVRRKMSYEGWYYSHLAVYLGLALAVGHQFELGWNINHSRVFAGAWYFLYALSLGSLAWGRALRPLALFARHRFRVEKILPETTAAESIWITGGNMERLKAEAGQFALLRFWAPGFRLQSHPFSLSRMPDGRYLRFTVKNLGDFTAAVHHSLRPGVPVLIDGPYGTFTEKKCLGDKALLIAGGIGITPIRALAERLLAEDKDCLLLYGNRTQKDVVFRKELRELEEDGGLRLVHVLSDDPDWAGEKGLLDAGAIRRLAPDYAERDVFMCGPEPMMDCVRKALTGLGMPGSRIHSEEFVL